MAQPALLRLSIWKARVVPTLHVRGGSKAGVARRGLLKTGAGAAPLSCQFELDLGLANSSGAEGGCERCAPRFVLAHMCFTGRQLFFHVIAVSS